MNDELAAYQRAIDLAKAELSRLRSELTILRDACRPAATLLFNLDQRGNLGLDTHRAIRETLAPLDAALAATKGE